MTDEGKIFPDFLLDHVASEWSGVSLNLIDPDICMKVDSALSFCGCIRPTAKLRQMVYLYQDSRDFDYETIGLLTGIASCVNDESEVWSEVIEIEFQRDCGTGRDEYLLALQAVSNRVEATNVLVEELMSA